MVQAGGGGVMVWAILLTPAYLSIAVDQGHL